MAYRGEISHGGGALSALTDAEDDHLAAALQTKERVHDSEDGCGEAGRGTEAKWRGVYLRGGEELASFPSVTERESE